MAHQDTVSSFMELSGLSRATVITLFNEMGPGEVNFYEALRKAAASGRLTTMNACSAMLSHLTSIQRSRADILSQSCPTPGDLDQAIISASRQGDLDRPTTALARMRALTHLSQSRARYFLDLATPKDYLEGAISKAQNSGEISSQVAAIALMRIVTGFNQTLAKGLLSRASVQGNVSKAVVEGAKYFEGPFQYATARLRATFHLREEDAKTYLGRRDVNGDFQEAVRQYKVDQVMKQVIVDRDDAYNSLQQHGGDVAKTVEMVKNTQLLQPFYGGENADTRNPPDVHRNTHIVAVLGVSDLGNQRRASPRADGWMVSDFYLWMNVLEGMGRSQKWLSCENPYALIHSYGSEDSTMDWTDDHNELQNTQVSWKEGYLHGDAFEERVVVLSRKNVDKLAARVTLAQGGTALRDEFLRQVEETCRKAEAADEPVLLMGFCHGDDGDREMGGLCIGIDPRSRDANEFLSPSMLASSLSKTPRVKVSLYLTSCYSGNWVITPHFRLIKPTVMAGAQADQETLAWELSCSQRHAGGVYTSAFLRELQKEPIELPEDASADEARTYQQVCQGIINEAHRLWVQLGGSTPMFTQDGGHDKFWKRTGFSLADYKRNFDRLDKVPASDAKPLLDRKRHVADISEEERLAWEARHPEVADLEFGSRTGGYGGSWRGMSGSLIYLAKRYASSHPGPRNSPSNTSLHNDIELFFSGALDKNLEHIEQIRSQVLYRTWAMRSANSYREWLNLNKVPVIQEWDQENPGKPLALAKENLPMIRGSGLFQRPDSTQGYWGQVWQKPFYYLAYAFAASGYGPSDIPKLLRLLKENQRKTTIRRKNHFMTMPHSQKSVQQMSDVLESTWRKSGVKRKRRSLEEAGLMPSSPGRSVFGSPGF